MKVLMINIATHKYTKFVNNFYSSCRMFLPKIDVNYLLFTDDMNLESKINVPIKKSYIEHKPFPEPTLKRYHYFLQEKEHIKNFDYVFYSDIDMLFTRPISENDVISELTLTIHPLIKHKHQFTYENNPKSTAFINKETEGNHYFCGGFNGGSSQSFLKMSETLSKNINTDNENGIVAIWHDESHLNRYAIDNPPTKIVDWCVTDYNFYSDGFGKLICLSKNHNEVRF